MELCSVGASPFVAVRLSPAKVKLRGEIVSVERRGGALNFSAVLSFSEQDVSASRETIFRFPLEGDLVAPVLSTVNGDLVGFLIM